jgi:hypothetical protein
MLEHMSKKKQQQQQHEQEGSARSIAVMHIFMVLQG